MDPVTTGFSILYAFVLGAFAIGALIYWYQNRDTLRRYKPIGFTMGFVLIFFEILTLISLAANDVVPSILQIILIDFIAFFRIAAFTIVGIEQCARLNLFSFPWLIDLFGEGPQPVVVKELETNQDLFEINIDSKLPTISAEQDEDVIGDFGDFTEDEEVDSLVEYESDIVEPQEFNLNEMLGFTTLVTIGMILFSVALFLLTTPQMSAILSDQLGESGTEITFLSFLIVITFAFIEEITFRLGIQNILAVYFDWRDNDYWRAIIFTSLFWTIGHVGVLDPNWIKMVQIFPIGLALGWLFKRYGVESTILAHVAFNVIMVIPAQYLIS